MRRDADHKLLAVPLDSPEKDLTELSELEKEELLRLYPQIDAEAG